MKLSVPKETAEGERRVALVPEVAKKLSSQDVEVVLESGAGESAHVPDGEYEEAGAGLGDGFSGDVVAKVAPPSAEEIGRMKEGTVLIGFLQPLTNGEVAQGAGAGRGHLVRDGGHPADHPRAVDGRALEPGHGRRLPRRR